MPGLVLALQLTACGIDDNNNQGASDTVTTSAATIITGSVGDGPITGATLNIYDRDGNLIQTEVSDSSASYSARIKAKGNAYPLTIETSGGVDLVTGRAPDFRLTSVVSHPSVKSVNINPFTTLIVESARLMPGGVNEHNISAARLHVMRQLNFGLDPRLISDPIGTAIEDGNVAVMVKASEALGEMIRRTADGLQAAGLAANADQVVEAISNDLVDGVLDGLGGTEAGSRVAALATLTSAQVLVEVLSNNLRVDGSVATAALDAAIRNTHPSVPDNGLTAGVRVNPEMLDQVRTAVAAARALAPSIQLTTIADTLEGIESDSLAGDIEAILPGDTSADLEPVIMLASSVSEQELAVVIEVIRLASGSANSAPLITGTPSSSVAEGNAYLFVPSASDPDGDNLVFSIQNRPAWASFDSGTGRLAGTPGNADVGTYSNIVISVSDGIASSALPAFSIGVSATTVTNSVPEISGTPAGSVAEDSAYAFLPSASDADGDNLSFSISNRPSWASFNSATGRLSGTPNNDHVGTYENITITVSDGKSVVSLAPFSIQVINTNDAPTITGNPAGSVDAGNVYGFQPVASDPDGDSLTFSIQNRPAWASFNTSTGRLTGTPTASDVGTYSDIRITVSDGTVGTALATFSLTVNSTAPQTGSASLSWAAPTARSDGTPLSMSEIAGYTLYYGSSAGNYSTSVDINDPFTTSITVTDLPVGTYYFVMTARDTDGQESGYSSVAQRQVQ
jgi:hypothetical protein